MSKGGSAPADSWWSKWTSHRLAELRHSEHQVILVLAKLDPRHDRELQPPRRFHTPVGRPTEPASPR